MSIDVNCFFPNKSMQRKRTVNTHRKCNLTKAKMTFLVCKRVHDIAERSKKLLKLCETMKVGFLIRRTPPWQSNGIKTVFVVKNISFDLTSMHVLFQSYHVWFDLLVNVRNKSACSYIYCSTISITIHSTLPEMMYQYDQVLMHHIMLQVVNSLK